MRELFLGQLIGDVVKIFCWLVAYLMWAKALMKTFVITEMLCSICFVILSIFFVNRFGLVGMSYAYPATYCLCFI